MPSKSGTRAPGPLLLHTDYARSAIEFESLFLAWPVLARAARGDGQPVLVVPGLVTDDATTFMLRTFLGRLGYRTYGWGLGRNIGPTAKAVHGLRARLDRIRARHAQPVSVIGWSLRWPKMSRSAPATSASATTRRCCGSWPTGWPSPEMPGRRSGRLVSLGSPIPGPSGTRDVISGAGAAERRVDR